MKALSDCRILVVDDTKANLDILVAGLKDDHKLSLARSGEDALRLATRMPPDLVLLDIMMPGMDGYEVCRRLRADPETTEVPIIFLSSLDEVQNKARGFEAGANDYVTKPFELLEVKARVRSLLKAKAYNDAVKEQMAGELRVARDIQMGMVPHDFARWEADYRVNLAGALTPAREVGGDLYCVFPAGPDRLVLAMGDVSGKGIPAALFMVRTTSFLQLLARDVAEPERMLARLNNELAADNPSEMFVTLTVAVYEPGKRRLSLANGGQTRPILLQPGKPPRWMVDHLGTALGLEPGLEFSRVDVELNPGDSMLLYTDGINEAFNSANECYGNERLIRDVAEDSGLAAPALVDRLLQRVSTFADGAPQSDDITVLALHLPAANGDSAPAEERGFALNLQATPQEVMRAVETLQAFGREQGIPDKILFGLALSLEESGSNVVHHAHQDDASRCFSVKATLENERITLELRDRGPAYDPTQPSPRAEVVDPEDRPPGGWGLELIRNYIDEVTYAREGQENVLRLSKLLSP